MPPPNPSGNWYQTVNPNEHIYTTGFGFSYRPPFLIERKTIQSYASGIALACLCFFVCRSLLHELVYWALRNLVYSLAPWALISNQTCLQLAYCLSYGASLCFPFWVYQCFVRIPLSSALPARRAGAKLLLPGICVGLAASTVGYATITATGGLLGFFGLAHLNSSLALPSDPPALLFYCLGITVVPAVAEELVFRGVVLQSLRRFGDGFALLCSAAVFAVMHGNVMQAGNAFLMGLVIGYFVLMSGNIWVGVGIHLANNLLVLLLGSLSYIVAGQAVCQAIQMGAYMLYIVGGVAALLYLTRSTTGLFDLRPAQTACSEPQKLRYFFASPAMVIYLVTAAVCAAQLIHVAR